MDGNHLYDREIYGHFLSGFVQDIDGLLVLTNHAWARRVPLYEALQHLLSYILDMASYKLGIFFQVLSQIHDHNDDMNVSTIEEPLVSTRYCILDVVIHNGQSGRCILTMFGCMKHNAQDVMTHQDEGRATHSTLDDYLHTIHQL